MKFKHAAAPFTYTLYDHVHTGSLQKYKKKITWKLLYCLPSEPMTAFFAFIILLRVKTNILTLEYVKTNFPAALMLKINNPSSRQNLPAPPPPPPPGPFRIKWSSP